MLNFHTTIYALDHSVVYSNAATNGTTIAVLYVLATCGSLFFSGYRYIIALGAVNLVGVLLVIWLKHYAFTSVWCTYAAVVSVLIYLHFSRRYPEWSQSRREPAHPSIATGEPEPPIG